MGLLVFATLYLGLRLFILYPQRFIVGVGSALILLVCFFIGTVLADYLGLLSHSPIGGYEP